METRNQTEIFGLGPKITEDDAVIKGGRLPTGMQVLRCLCYHLESGRSENKTKYEAAKEVVKQIVVFYEKANIPMISDNKAGQKIVRLYENNLKLRRIPVKQRQSDTSQKRLKDSQEDLAKTMPLWCPDALSIMKNEEDKSFLQSMMTDRKSHIGPVDTVSAEKIKRKMAREEAAESQRKKAKTYEEKASQKVSSLAPIDAGSEDDEETAGQGTSDDSEVAINLNPRSHHRQVRSGTQVIIPSDILKKPKVVSMAGRLKVTPTQQAALTKCIIEESGGDVSRIAKSYATADRARRSVVSTIAASVKETWESPKFGTLHWDGKLMAHLDNQVHTEERLAILVSSEQETRLLGVPAYTLDRNTQRAGDVIANHCCTLLDEWQCKDCIIAMAFDTTASNTGHLTGACIRMQDMLQKPLLWCACRHHVGEVILTQIFNDLKIEASRGPDISVFSRLKKNYEKLYQDQENYSLFCINTALDADQTEWLEDLQNAALQLSATKLEYLRDDYKELCTLVQLFLGPDATTKSTALNRPGAIHQARWMSKMLYCLKICLLEKAIQRLPPGTVTTKAQIPKIKQFCNFVALIYFKWWINASSTFDAAHNDLTLYHALIKYEAVDKTVAKSALNAFQRHLWYLTAEMVPLSLFSTHVSPEEKQCMAQCLLAAKPASSNEEELYQRSGAGFGKPQFPKVTHETTLHSLISSDSWFLFSKIKQDPTPFLEAPVCEWTQNELYQECLSAVSSITVTNDAAERGVKIGQDFLQAARSEKFYQDLLLTVDQNRKENPKLRK